MVISAWRQAKTVNVTSSAANMWSSNKAGLDINHGTSPASPVSRLDSIYLLLQGTLVLQEQGFTPTNNVALRWKWCTIPWFFETQYDCILLKIGFRCLWKKTTLSIHSFYILSNCSGLLLNSVYAISNCFEGRIWKSNVGIRLSCYIIHYICHEQASSGLTVWLYWPMVRVFMLSCLHRKSMFGCESCSRFIKIHRSLRMPIPPRHPFHTPVWSMQRD